jgi:antitoxin component YwqK of YwqJK toxin-antitoxin module
MSYGKLCLEKEYTMHTEYYKDGTPCKCDRIYRDYHFPSGSTWKEIPYANGKMHGIIKYYYETGGLSSAIPYKKGRAHGIAKWYYETGVLQSTIPYTNGLRHGIIKEYHSSGALAALSMHNHGDSCTMNGCPTENFV